MVVKQALKPRQSSEATRSANEQPRRFDSVPDSTLRTDATIVASQQVRSANAPKTRQASLEAVLRCSCLLFPATDIALVRQSAQSSTIR